MRKVWDIHGGVHPPESKTQSNHCAIASIELAEELVLPLSQHIGAPSTAVVTVGDRVLKGQLIAEAQGLISAPIHASTSGTVTAIEQRPIAHPSGMTADCIVLKPDGLEEWIEIDACNDYKALEKTEILAKIRGAGISGMGGAGFPAAVKLNPRPNQKITTLILNGTECEPYITADDMLMREHANEIIAGALLLAHLLDNPSEILVGIEDNKPEAIATMQAAAENTAVEIVVFPTKYPSGGEKQLIEIVTGKQVPSGALPASIGIVVQNVGSAFAAWRAVRFGEPLISRVTTVVGESLALQRNIEVPLGTPIQHILQQHGWQQENAARLIIGGPMMGYTVESPLVPVVKTTNCILAPSRQEVPEQPPAQPCIRCGMCAEACPASLLPQQLFWFAQSENYEKLREHDLFDCIECGACSYVCPSNIPLVQYYRASKSEIRIIDADKQKSDRARVRFEARKARIEQAEAEKEAKRVARKIAAEQAKRLADEKKALAGPQGTATTTSSELADKASTAAKPTDVDPATELAKLERALSSAQSRQERATASLTDMQREDPDNTARIESLQARLKQAQLKVNEAEQKLGSFKAAQNSVVATETIIKQKLTSSPLEQLQKSVETIGKRLTTAREKLAEAEAAGTPTVEALRQGVAKLQQKLDTSERELVEAKAATSTASEVATEVNSDHNKTLSAADIAIEKAKAKAAAQANMSDTEKRAAQLTSLQSRLTKARERLAKAEAENNENIDAFRIGVEKLEVKLAEAKEDVKEKA